MRFGILAGALVLSCAHESPSKQAVSAPQENVVAHAVDVSEPFEIDFVNDSSDAFGEISDEKLPFGSGIAIFRETVPIGLKHFSVGHFARIVFRDGDTWLTARARFLTWADRSSIVFARGDHFGFGEVLEEDPASKTSKPIGIRTYVLHGDPILTHRDVAEANVVEGDEDVPEISIAMKLDKDGARKLQVATTDWAFRRLAILSHGKVEAAPVVKASIDDGELQLVIGPRSDAIVARAKKLTEEIQQK